MKEQSSSLSLRYLTPHVTYSLVIGSFSLSPTHTFEHVLSVCVFVFFSLRMKDKEIVALKDTVREYEALAEKQSNAIRGFRDKAIEEWLFEGDTDMAAF